MKIRNETEIQLMKILFKTSKKKPTKNLTSKRAYPFGVENELYGKLKGFFKPLTDYVKKYIDENMESLLRGDSDMIRLDAIPGDSFRNMIYNLENYLSVYMPDISELPASSNNNIILTSLSKTAENAKKFGDKEFSKTIEKGIHVNPPITSEWWNSMRDSWAEDNYTLIVSNAKKYVSQINTLTEQAIVNGLSPSKLKEQISKATNSLSDAHCKLLARDQMGKLNGQITQAQMQEVGLDLYVWSTAYDDRVRDSHAVMEGLLCRWDNASVCSYDNGKTWEPRPAGAVDLHPGQDIQCRCNALTFYPELEAEMEGVPMETVISEDLIENNAFQLEILKNDFVETGWRVPANEQIQPKKCENLSGLYAMATKAHPEFSEYTKDMIKDFKDMNLKILERKELKGADRIKEKLIADQLKFEKAGGTGFKYYDIKNDKLNTCYILDIDGNTIVCQNVSDVQAVLEKYNNSSNVVRIKNNFAKPSDLGYSDINMNVKMSNGVIAETQINTVANIVAKEQYGHSLYEVFRSVDDNMGYSRLKNYMSDAQKKLYKMSNELSRSGGFPKVKGDIFKYRYEPYEKAIKEYVEKAIPEYKKAKNNGLLNDKTVEHFEKLCKNLGVKIL